MCSPLTRVGHNRVPALVVILVIFLWETWWFHGVLLSGWSSPGKSPGQEHCIVYLGTTLMGTGEFNAGGNSAMN